MPSVDLQLLEMEILRLCEVHLIELATVRFLKDYVNEGLCKQCVTCHTKVFSFPYKSKSYVLSNAIG
jgi:hypothetical protein